MIKRRRNWSRYERERELKKNKDWQQREKEEKLLNCEGGCLR